MIKSLLLDLENFPYTVRIYKNQSNKNNLCHRVLLNNQFTSSWTYFFLINKSTSLWSATSFTISVVVLRRKGNTNYSSTLRLILFSLEQFLSLKFTDSARFRQILLSNVRITRFHFETFQKFTSGFAVYKWTEFFPRTMNFPYIF